MCNIKLTYQSIASFHSPKHQKSSLQLAYLHPERGFAQKKVQKLTSSKVKTSSCIKTINTENSE